MHPTDPLLCLLCSVACLSRATNRQVDNRNHTIVQGLAILQQYAALRPGSAEVEYNLGRAYQQVGLLHLAVPRYQRVLAMAEERTTASTDPGFHMTREAAYNLALVYASAGSPHVTEALFHRWLAV